VVNEDSPHQPIRHRHEVRAILPVHAMHVHQPHVRLVDERRSLPARSLAMQRPAMPRNSQ
jgi:hypothetical protein